jgi:hypothetical protein
MFTGVEGAMNIAGTDGLVQGAKAALQAWTHASDAYAQNLTVPSVAFWSLVIAAGLVLVEWLVARGRVHPGAPPAGR